MDSRHLLVTVVLVLAGVFGGVPEAVPGDLVIDLDASAVALRNSPIARRELRAMLLAHADRARDTAHPLRPACGGVLLRVPGDLPWWIVGVALLECADPGVRIHRVRIGPIGEPAGEIRLDRHRWLGAPAPPGAWMPMLEVVLKDGRPTRYEVLDRPMGVGEMGLSALRTQLLRIRELYPDVLPAVRAWPQVPIREVARVLRLFRECGYPAPIASGVVPSRWSPEEVRLAARSLGGEELLTRARAGLAGADRDARDVAAGILGELGPAALPVVVEALERRSAHDCRDLFPLLGVLVRLRGPDGEPVDLAPALPAARAAVADSCSRLCMAGILLRRIEERVGTRGRGGD